MWFRDSFSTCDGSLIMQVFPLIFNIGMVHISTILLQMGEGYDAIQRGEGCL